MRLFGGVALDVIAWLDAADGGGRASIKPDSLGFLDPAWRQVVGKAVFERLVLPAFPHIVLLFPNVTSSDFT